MLKEEDGKKKEKPTNLPLRETLLSKLTMKTNWGFVASLSLSLVGAAFLVAALGVPELSKVDAKLTVTNARGTANVTVDGTLRFGMFRVCRHSFGPDAPDACVYCAWRLDWDGGADGGGGAWTGTGKVFYFHFF